MVNSQPTIIYVIDDEPIDNMISKLLIKRIDAEMAVSAIENCQKAIKKLKELIENQPDELPDFIFLDINMPGMNGWQFLSEFEGLQVNRFKKVKIYMLSSSIHKKDLIKAHSNPLVEDFIIKPLDLENLRFIFKAA